MNHEHQHIKYYSAFTGGYDGPKHMACITGWHVPMEGEEPFEPHWESIV